MVHEITRRERETEQLKCPMSIFFTTLSNQKEHTSKLDLARTINSVLFSRMFSLWQYPLYLVIFIYAWCLLQMIVFFKFFNRLKALIEAHYTFQYRYYTFLQLYVSNPSKNELKDKKDQYENVFLHHLYTFGRLKLCF